MQNGHLPQTLTNAQVAALAAACAACTCSGDPINNESKIMQKLDPQQRNHVASLIDQLRSDRQHLLPLRVEQPDQWQEYVPWLADMLQTIEPHHQDVAQRLQDKYGEIQQLPAGDSADRDRLRAEIKQLKGQQVAKFSLLPNAALTPAYIRIDSHILQVRMHRPPFTP